MDLVVGRYVKTNVARHNARATFRRAFVLINSSQPEN